MSLRHAVLGLLADEPASGYDLLKVFDRSLAFIWPATQSQLYGELNRLADDGLIEVTHQGPRGRKDYSITYTDGPSSNVGSPTSNPTASDATKPCCVSSSSAPSAQNEPRPTSNAKPP